MWFENRILALGSHAGYKWAILHNGLGYRCGYVAIPVNHPWWCMPYQKIDADVHGGLTFNESDVYNNDWWIGFDCAHLGDAQDPALPCETMMPEMGGTIKSMSYVQLQCEKLCEQAKEAYENTRNK